MDVDKLAGVAIRVFVVGAFALLTVAVTEWILNYFEISLVNRVYVPGRLMEFAAIALVFAIALLLRQVRDELRKPRI